MPYLIHRMTNKINKIIKQFRDLTDELKKSHPEIKTVYNASLDEITKDSEIKLILVGDNPGKRELEQGRYLVGPSGKIAARFFRENPSLGIDFYKNVIILNKTPIHTPRTIQLRELLKTGDASLAATYEKSQKQMAHILLEFQEALSVPVYITGYSEMKKRGLFETYTKEIKKIYGSKPDMLKNLFIFRHFSMNQFTIDLKKQALPGESVKKSLNRIGSSYRQRILEMI